MPDRKRASFAQDNVGWLAPHRLFLLLAPLIYAFYALITPPFETPDEHQHLFRAWQISSFQFLGESRNGVSGGELPPGLVAAAKTELGTAEPHLARRDLPKATWAERFDRATAIGGGQPVQFANFTGSASYSPVAYVPQVLAIWAGRALDLSVENLVRLGRLLNAALACLLLYGAMRTLPVGRLLLLVVALLPMTASCAGSLGQDGLIIGGSAWLVALCVRCVVDRQWSSRDGWAALALTSVITLAKMVYLPLIGLGLFLRGTNGRLRPSAFAALAGLAAAALLALWLWLSSSLPAPQMAGLPTPGEQLRKVISEPSLFPIALSNTFNLDGQIRLGQRLFMFGWMNVGPVGMAWLASVAAWFVALWSGDSRGDRLTIGWRLWSLVICALIVVLIAAAMYLGATPLGSDRIEGLQGRYFIPLFLPISLAFLRRSRRSLPLLPVFVAGAMIAANVSALNAIIEAFYS